MSGGEARGSLPLSSLVGDDDGAAAIARGVRTLKLKVSGAVEELATLRRVAALGDDVQVRLDANRSLSPIEHGEFLAAAAAHAVLIEEPFAAWPTEPVGIPLAADESLQDGPSIPAGASAVVLKPTTLGLSLCVELATEAAARGVAVIVSHCFDGPIAHAAASALALAVASEACGLDRHRGLAAWPERPLPHLTASTIVATSRPGLGVEL